MVTSMLDTISEAKTITCLNQLLSISLNSFNKASILFI